MADDHPILNSEFIQAAEDEHNSFRLALALLLVKAAGGTIVVPRQMISDLRADRTSVLTQTTDMNGDITFTVTETPNAELSA